MYKLQEYKNTLPSKDYNYFTTQHHIDLNALLDYYSEYISNPEKVAEMFSKIKNLKYINAGFVDWEEWKHNKHIFVINGFAFEYKTGTGINCRPRLQELRDKGVRIGDIYSVDDFNFTKLLFDAVYCFLQEAYDATNYSEDDFLEEFGYIESVAQYKKGVSAYNEMKINSQKAISIWGKELINNLFDYVQL